MGFIFILILLWWDVIWLVILIFCRYFDFLWLNCNVYFLMGRFGIINFLFLLFLLIKGWLRMKSWVFIYLCVVYFMIIGRGLVCLNEYLFCLLVGRLLLKVWFEFLMRFVLVLCLILLLFFMINVWLVCMIIICGLNWYLRLLSIIGVFLVLMVEGCGLGSFFFCFIVS